MANAHRGEIAFTAGDKAYTLRLSVNAIAEVEGLLDAGIADIVETLRETPKMSTIRAILWGGLREFHPKLSLLDAGEIIDELGVQETSQLVGRALEAAFPQPEGEPRPSQEAA